MEGQSFYTNRSKYILIIAICAVVCTLILLVYTQPKTVAALSTRTPIQVTLNADSRPEVYSFRPSLHRATTLLFESTDGNTPFTAEVRDDDDVVVAVLNSGHLQTATLTVPPGEGIYTVTVLSTDPRRPGRVSISLSRVTPTPASARSQAAVSQDAESVPVTFTDSRYAPKVCNISTAHPGGVNMRVAPNPVAEVVAVMPPDTPHAADTRTGDGWYRIGVDGRIGWVLGTVVNLSGVCDSLPVQTAANNAYAIGGAAIPGVTAPYDLDVYYFGADRDGGGQFTQSISYPNGDSTDRILLTINNFAVTDRRAYTLALDCNGNGAEYVQWGTLDNPTLQCGQAASVTFAHNANQQNLIVTFPGGVGQSYVDYEIRVEPVAPADITMHTFAAHRDAGGRFSDSVSYPNGDSTDRIHLSILGLEANSPDNYREVNLSLLCSGAGTEYVRWGVPENPTLECGHTVMAVFMHDSNQNEIVVTLPDNSGQGYVSYTLLAMPVAAYDAPEYFFGVDRDAGGRFSETISYPHGDTHDLIQMTISNLSERPPNNYREVNLTLYCSGQGVEYVRWGVPENPALECGNTVVAAFIHSSNRQPLAVTVLPEGSGQTYIYYTLVATVATAEEEEQ